MVDRKKIIEGLLHNIHAMRHKLMVSYSGAKKAPVTPSQGCALRFIAKNSPANVKAVAKALQISSSAATQLIESLVTKGYLMRRHAVHDRRVISLTVTPKAQKLFIEFKKQGLKKMTMLFSALTDEELAQYAALNARIAASITN